MSLHICKRLPILRADRLGIVPILEKCLDRKTAVSIVIETKRELFIVAMCVFSSVGHLLPFPASLGHSIRCQQYLYSLYGESCDRFRDHAAALNVKLVAGVIFEGDVLVLVVVDGVKGHGPGRRV